MAAVAAIAAVSCNKIENEQASNVRTVTAGFDQETRTSLSGNSVSWEVGDEITVMNEAGVPELHTIAEGNLNNGKVTFTTSLTGQLYAIYGGTDASVVEGEVSFTIPSSQSGAFKDANICVAKLDANNHFAFKNATAIVHFTNCKASLASNPFSNGKKGSVKSISVSTLPSVSASFSDSFSASGSGTEITISKMDTIDSEYYFAVAPGDCEFVISAASSNANGTCTRSKSLSRSMIYNVDISKLTFIK